MKKTYALIIFRKIDFYLKFQQENLNITSIIKLRILKLYPFKIY